MGGGPERSWLVRDVMFRLKYSAGLGWAIESKFDKKEGYSGRDDFFKDRAEGDCCRDPL
jgi:hypothetical protein